MRIEFKRSGGFMGMSVAVTVDTDAVPAEESRVFREMVTSSSFFKLPPEFPSPQSRPDQFHYKLTYVGLALCVLGVTTWTVAIVNIADIPLEMEGDKPGEYDMVFSPSRGEYRGVR